MIRRSWRRLRSWATGGTGRSGLTIRVRLSALYGILFLVSGGVLLAFTNLLVDRHLPGGDVYAARVVNAPGPLQIVIRRTSGVIGAGGRGGVAIAGPNVNFVPLEPANPDPQAIFAQLKTTSDAQRTAAVHQLVLDSALALGVMALASSLLGWLMAGRALRPVEVMTSAARDISEYNLHQRLPEAGPRDELRHLASTFNALLGRLEAAFDSQRRFVANASHELRTPLTLERAVVEVNLADPDADVDALRAMGQRVLDIGAQQEVLIEALLTLARSQRGLDQRQPVDLEASVAAAVEAASARAAAGSITVAADLNPAWVSGDKRLIDRMAANVVDNAVQHNYPGGWVRVETTTGGTTATLRVRNSGPVVDPEEVNGLLQPFQRQGQERAGHPSGIGLGLSIVEAIASAHEGRLDIAARPEGGLAVVVALPGADPATPS